METLEENDRGYWREAVETDLWIQIQYYDSQSSRCIIGMESSGVISKANTSGVLLRE